LEDLLKELEKAPDEPARPAKSSFRQSQAPKDDYAEVTSMLDATLDSLTLGDSLKPATTRSSYGSSGGSGRQQSTSSYSSGASSNVYGASDDPGASMDAILSNMSTAFASSGDDPLSKDILGLSSSNEREQERALRNIINLCLEDSNRTLLRQRDGIAPIVKLLGSPNKTIQMLACHAIANLSLQPENRHAVRATRVAIPELVKALGSPEERVQEKALSAIANLCVDDPTNRGEFRTAGVMPKLVTVLASTNDDVVKRALTALVNTSFDTYCQQEFVRAGGIYSVVPFLTCMNAEKQTNAAWALAALTMGGEDVQNALYDAGAIPGFIKLLSSGNDQAELKSLTALVNLSGNDRLQRPIVDHGGIPAVLRHVSSRNPNCQKLALQTLQNLAISDAGRQAINSNGGVDRIVGVLRQNIPDLLPHALRVTINLTGDAQLRRAFLNAGATPLVESLTNNRDPAISNAARQASGNLKIPC